MAGKNLIIEPGKILFKKGDKPNGMFIVRSGELKVYMDDNGQEVSLALIPPGGMIGEMALFDQKPRSASVKATAKTEVTAISEDDFKKLTTQIPKWFTTLMSALVGRLRTTNDRLQELEAKNPQAGLKRFVVIQRVLHLLDILWHRDGEKKSGKEWFLETRIFKSTACEQFCEDPVVIDKLIAAMFACRFYEPRKNDAKIDVLMTPNRGDLTRILLLLSAYLKKSPKGPLPTAALELLDAMVVLSQPVSFDAVSFSYAEIEAHGREQNAPNVGDWKKILPLFVVFGDDVRVSGAGPELSVKVRKKEVKDLAMCHRLLAALYDAMA